MIPDCAICGHGVEEDRAEITVEFREGPPEKYVMHETCARSVTGSWWEPA